MKSRRIGIFFIIFNITFLFMIAFLIITNKPITLAKNVVTIEAGQAIDPYSFLVNNNSNIQIINDVEINEVGNYNIIYQVENYEKKLKVKVVDTIKPKVTVKNIEKTVGSDINPYDFVDEIIDETNVDVSFKEDYDFSVIGEQTVELVFKDQGKNQVIKEAVISIIEVDTIAPIINLKYSSIEIYKGEDIQFDDLVYEMSDNQDESPILNIDIGTFNSDVTGTYEISYHVTDKSDNETVKTLLVKVKTKEVTNDLPDTDKKIAWLTFDDGPSKNTQAVLDILDKYNIKATFFVIGSNPDYYYLIKEAYNRGHSIGLHSYTHEYDLVYQSEEAYYDDLEEIGEVVKEQIGYVPSIIRFPGGSSNTISHRYSKGIMSKLTKSVLERGYQYFDWNTSNGDGGVVAHSNELVNTLKQSVANRQFAMILFHDGNQSAMTVESLEESIEYLIEQGFEFRTIDDETYGFTHRINN